MQRRRRDKDRQASRQKEGKRERRKRGKKERRKEKLRHLSLKGSMDVEWAEKSSRVASSGRENSQDKEDRTITETTLPSLPQRALVSSSRGGSAGRCAKNPRLSQVSLLPVLMESCTDGVSW